MLKRVIYGACASVLMVASANAEEHVVVQKNKQFAESKIVIKAGDKVVFQNDDLVVHNVYSRTPGLGFATEVQMPGKSSIVTFDKPGTVEVVCAMHAGMKLTIEVQK